MSMLIDSPVDSSDDISHHARPRHGKAGVVSCTPLIRARTRPNLLPILLLPPAQLLCLRRFQHQFHPLTTRAKRRQSLLPCQLLLVTRLLSLERSRHRIRLFAARKKRRRRLLLLLLVWFCVLLTSSINLCYRPAGCGEHRPSNWFLF